MRTGSVLVLVLMSIVIMSLATSSYLVLMRNEHRATRYHGQQQQARLLTESGVEYLRVFLNQSDALITEQGGLTANPTYLQGRLVADDVTPGFRGRFSVIAPDIFDGYYNGARFGLENESAKLNLHTLAGDDVDEQAARERLLWLPGMTETTADAILDWIDDNELPRAYGAEQTHYQSLTPPYEPRNRPLLGIDELLLVRGVTPELLYGIDANRNYSLDTQEQPEGLLVDLDNSLGQMNHGWAAYLTLHGAEGNFTSTGESKINVNSAELETLHSALLQVVDQRAANFIIAYRQYGPSASTGDPQAGASGDDSAGNVDAGSLSLDFSIQPTTEIASLLDLVGVNVEIEESSQGGSQRDGDNSSSEQEPPSPGNSGGGRNGPSDASGGGPSQIVASPWPDNPNSYGDTLLTVLDNLTTTEEQATIGRVNINLASRPVLLTLPGMTEAIVDQILTMRETTWNRVTSPQRHAIWLLANNVVTLDEMKELDPQITAGGDVYSCQVVGFFDEARPRARVRVILDRTSGNTQLVGWEDLSELGPGFTLAELGAVTDGVE